MVVNGGGYSLAGGGRWWAVVGGGGYILTGGGLWWMVVDGDRWLWMVVGGGIV